MSLELKRLLESAPFPLKSEAIERILQFYAAVVQENEIQNLTRLISPQDFYEGHVLDVFELLNSGLVDFPAIDLGSGAGVPGLLAAVIRPDSWVLSESEGRKAEYLQKVVTLLNLGNHVQVVSGRVEEYLKKKTTQSIVARAVGPVDRIYSWIRKCSTWNNLILLKGPGWTEEWQKFQELKFAKELKVTADHSYVVGLQAKSRRILKLIRTK